MAIRTIFSAEAVSISKSLASLRYFLNQANVRSTIQRLGGTAKAPLIFYEMCSLSFSAVSTKSTAVPR